MGFFRGLVEIFSPVRYKVENNTSYGGRKGPVFKQYFVFKSDALKEYKAWIKMGNYDTSLYEREDLEWKLINSFEWGKDVIDEV